MNAMRADEGAPDSAPEFPVTEKTLRITLRRVRDGKVRRLGGDIVDAGRPVPIYVAAALRELVGHEQIKLAKGTDGERYEITPAGQSLYDESRRPQSAAEPASTPRRRFRRASLSPETRWPQLAFLVDDTNPPWTFTTLTSGMVVAKHCDDSAAETVWVLSARRAGYVRRPLPRLPESVDCTFRGPLDRLATFLRVSTHERSV
jgi:hypothetical protein